MGTSCELRPAELLPATSESTQRLMHIKQLGHRLS